MRKRSRDAIHLLEQGPRNVVHLRAMQIRVLSLNSVWIVC